jgi:hypothetical protein
VTAGTIFDRTRTLLTVWFAACRMLATQKDGRSARTRPLGDAAPGAVGCWCVRDLLAGVVEVDERFIGGEEADLRGGRARGKKVLTDIAVEVREPKESAGTGWRS